VSFSGETKKELCRLEFGHKNCVQAEAYGALLYCNTFTAGEIRLVTESPEFAQRLPALFKRAFQIDFDQRPELAQSGGKLSFQITDPYKLDLIFDTYGIDPGGVVAHHVNFAVLEEECCRASFLRGAFLAGGSVTDPEKRYHLELFTSHFNVSREMQALMQEGGFRPKETQRKSNYVIYFKQSEAIEDFLTAIGAPLAAMEVMNAKVEKHLRNGVNRRVNCDSANLTKAVDAAQEQREAIRALERRGALSELPDKLLQAAQLRLDHPELTLSQLAELCDPPITKSALNHRLRKLIALARDEA
jgi:hypothetical protein